MNPAGRRWLDLAVAACLSILLVVGLGFATNSLDTTRFSWDFRYYIAMAEHPFAAPQASPFAYRYATPLLVWGLSRIAALSTEAAFRAVAFGGAILQLVGVFLFVRWLTRSTAGAYFAVLVTGFSLFNIKFLLFDVYRPDHLAYALILIQSYLALKRQFWALLLTTLVAVQVREFNVAPLVAYVCVLAGAGPDAAGSQHGRQRIREGLVSVLCLLLAFGLPRLLIPVAEDYQFASATRDGLLRVLLAPLILSRDANFIYSVVAYLLPSLMIAGTAQAAAALGDMQADTRRYLLAYSIAVLFLSFLGGTDFYRFSSFLFLPQAVFVALVVDRSKVLPLAATLVGTVIFNRLWLPFPMSDVGPYLDFYGGSGTRFDAASILRIVELVALIAVGVLARRVASSSRGTAAAPS